MSHEAKLEWALGHRHGLLPDPVEIAAAPADLPGIHNWSVGTALGDPWLAAGGGVGWTSDVARNAAIAEALERYAAVSYPLTPATDGTIPNLVLDDFTLFSSAQRACADFPHRETFDGPAALTSAQRLLTGEPALVPAALIGLTDRYGALPNSSGLAAGATKEHALLRAVQELIERDAYMCTWLHGVCPPHRPLPDLYTAAVNDRQGWVVAFDITPDYSSHRVAMVVGNLPLEGRPRFSIGIACREQWTDAADKAYLEWSQGVIFAGHRARREPDLQFPGAESVRDFDDHAVYYTVHPDRWGDLPFMSGDSVLAPPLAASGASTSDPATVLQRLVEHLESNDIRLYSRDLTLIDLEQIGLVVVRVLSPELTPIHSDHRWPHLGGTTPDVSRRYAWVEASATLFPSPHPHALG